MTATTDEYFASMWSSDDPWEQATRFSEHRKFGITVASLPRARYRHAFEPGCATGILTEMLAARCERVTATDRHPRAVEVAARRVAHLPGVDVRLGRLPDDVLQGPFDLVVLSEVLYYLEEDGVRAALDRVAASATVDAHLVAVHYRPLVPEHALRGDAVHGLVEAHARWRPIVRHDEADFLLCVCERT
jgi:SAM-dependent methyltransferase